MSLTTSPKELLSTPYDLNLSDASIASFRQDGFIKLKAVLDAQTLAHYGEAVTTQTLANNRLADVPMEERSTYDQAFTQVGNLWEKDDTVRELTFSKRARSFGRSALARSGAVQRAQRRVHPLACRPTVLADANRSQCDSLGPSASGAD